MDKQPLKIRGLLYDTRLGIGKRGNFVSLFRLMEKLHLNTLMLYIENAYFSQRHPGFASPWAFKDTDIRFLVREGKNYGIDIIPCFQSLGHASGILKHERYKHLAETIDGDKIWGSQFCPSKKETLGFLRDIYEELRDLFPSPYFHVCCDESFELGICSACRRIVKDKGKDGLFVGYLIHLHKILNKLGKRMMVWGDMLLHYPGEIDKLPKDVIIVDWHYGNQKSYPSLEFFKKKGFEVIACTKIGGKGCYPNLEGQHVENVMHLTTQAVKMKLYGVVHSAWLDASCFLEWVYYPLSLGARISFEGKSFSIREFDSWFAKEFFGTEDLKIIGIIRGLSFSRLIRLKHRKFPRTDHSLWKQGWTHTWGDYSYPWQYLKKEDFLVYAYFNYQAQAESDSFYWIRRFPDERIQNRLVKIAKRLESKVSEALEELKRVREKTLKGYDILEMLEFSCLLYRYFSHSIIITSERYPDRERISQLKDETGKLRKIFKHLWQRRNLWVKGEVKPYRILAEREKILSKVGNAC